MILAIWIILFVTLFVCTWFAVIERAMFMSTPLVLRHDMEIRGMPQRGIWIEGQYETTLQSLSFVRLISLFVLMFCILMLFNADSITIESLVASSVLAVVLFWVTSSIIAGAIARAVPVGSVIHGWYFLRVVSLMNPAIHWLVESVAEISRRLTGANLSNSVGVNTVEEQLLRSIEHSQREGGIPAEAAEMLENVVDLRDTDVGEIMTPRTEIEGIEMTNDLREIRKFALDSGRSRIPVYEDNLDQIVGILYVKDMIGFLGAEANGFELRSILRKPIVVPDTKPVQELLADFQKSEVHMAVVIDEYGGTAGLVTIEDVLEEIVGEIRDEHDDSESDVPELKRINEHMIEVDGRYSLDDFNDELGVALPEDEEYDTLAGFVLAKLGHVPVVGESIDSHGIKITAIEVSDTQILRLLFNFSPKSDKPTI